MKDKELGVLMEIIKNQKTVIEILKTMLEDKNKQIVQLCKSNNYNKKEIKNLKKEIKQLWSLNGIEYLG